MQAADELMEAMHREGQIVEPANRIMNLQIQPIPQLAPFTDTMSEFLIDRLTGQKIRNKPYKTSRQNYNA